MHDKNKFDLIVNSSLSLKLVVIKTFQPFYFQIINFILFVIF